MVIDEIGTIPVILNGVRLFWLRQSDGTGALAYPDHIDEDGSLALHALASDSYAHVCDDGCIRRYREVIGRVSDLIMEN